MEPQQSDIDVVEVERVLEARRVDFNCDGSEVAALGLIYPETEEIRLALQRSVPQERDGPFSWRFNVFVNQQTFHIYQFITTMNPANEEHTRRARRLFYRSADALSRTQATEHRGRRFIVEYYGCNLDGGFHVEEPFLHRLEGVIFPGERGGDPEFVRQYLSTSAQVVHMLCDIASAVDCVHATAIVHRSVMPHSVLLRIDGSAKLGGFRFAMPAEGGLMSTGGPDHRVLPPELWRNNDPAAQLHFQYSTDVFAFGILCLETLLMERLRPRGWYYNMNRGDINNEEPRIAYHNYLMSKVETVRLRHDVTELVDATRQLRQLLTGCLDFEAARRPSMSEVSTRLTEIYVSLERPRAAQGI